VTGIGTWLLFPKGVLVNAGDPVVELVPLVTVIITVAWRGTTGAEIASRDATRRKDGSDFVNT